MNPPDWPSFIFAWSPHSVPIYVHILQSFSYRNWNPFSLGSACAVLPVWSSQMSLPCYNVLFYGCSTSLTSFTFLRLLFSSEYKSQWPMKVVGFKGSPDPWAQGFAQIPIVGTAPAPSEGGCCQSWASPSVGRVRKCGAPLSTLQKQKLLWKWMVRCVQPHRVP